MKSLIYRVLPIILVIGNSLYGGGLTSISLPPTVYSEANFYYDADTVLYSNALVVKFSEEVIDLMKGDRLAELSDIDTSFTEILAAFNILDSDYGIEYIVKQVPDAMWGDTTAVHKITGSSVILKNHSQLFIMQFENPIPIDSTETALSSVGSIAYAHQAVMIALFEAPNDPKYLDGSSNPQWYFDSLDASEAWDLTHGSSGIEIAIIDTGSCEDHNDLDDKFVSHDGKNGVHGTGVASAAAGETNNSEGISSLGWNTKLRGYNVKNTPITDPSTFVNSIYLSQRYAEVINFSLGTVRWARELDIYELCPSQYVGYWTNEILMPENYPEIEDEVENATTRGVVVVAAAGNGPIHAHAQGQSDCDLTYPPAEVYPAMYADVIAVSGTEIWLGEEQFKSGGSGYNYGSFVDVAAPAVDIWIAGPSSGSDPNCALTTSYALKSGTSFGAPMVAALASLLLHYEPDSSVIDIITSTAEKIASSQHAYDANGYNNWLGFGRINAYQALLSCHPTAPTGFSVTGGTGYHPTISWDLNDEDDVDGYKVYRKYGSGSWSVAADVSETTDEWEDTEVTLSTGKFDPLVCYKVTAYDLQSHESEASSSVCKRFDELSKFTKDSGKADVKDIKYLDLDRPFPNPFNSSVELRFQIPEDDYAQIVILDINARKVKTFSQNGYGFTSGQYSLLWDGTEDSGINMPSGVYFINLVGRKNVIVSKILLIK